ncbi:choice-of-anchor A family protein [Prosthecobacter sp. SYSU 5D2]|uniref:choice-of-anchor A family protein n=1 Tax=Prosthecobacter sp. SYSU 5D2 TaxID=3134134 RepID=UPI0031FE488D
MKTPSLIKVMGTAMAILLMGGMSASLAQSLDYQNYNAIIFNDLKTTSDVEGRTFVGNDFTGTNSANFGNHLKNTTASSDRSLVIGGDLVSGNPLNLQRGSLYIGGSTNGRIINFNGGGSVVSDGSIGDQLSAIQDYSIAQSMALQNLASDSSVTLPGGGQPGPTKFFATAGLDGLAVFHVNAADIFSNPLGQQFELLPDSHTQNIVINVSGTSVNWTQGNMVGQFDSNYWQGRLMWNFTEATSINLGSFNFKGAILAPFASITTSGNIDGLVVANNLTTTAEVHLPDSNSLTGYAFEGYLAPVPEPGSVIFLVAAAGVILISRNRRLWV